MDAAEGDRSPFPTGASHLAFGSFRYDVGNRLLYRDGEQVPLPLRVSEVLEYLLHHAGEVVEKRELLEAVWRDTMVGEDSLSKAVSLLRSALQDDPHDPEYVQTIPRRGYRFIAPLRPVAESATEGADLTEDDGGGATVPSDEGADRRAATDAPSSTPASPGPSAGTTGTRAASDGSPGAGTRWLYGAAWVVSLLVALAAGAFLSSPDDPRAPRASKFSVPLADEVSFQHQPGVAAAPDGSAVAFTSSHDGRNLLYLRRIDELDVEPLAGTEGARYPFFSPDGLWVAFFADGELRKISLQSREVLDICPVSMPFGGSWGADAVIVLSSGAYPGLLQVPADGGEPRPLSAKLSSTPVSTALRFPQLLDGGDKVLFSIGTPGDPGNWSIAVASRTGGEITTVVRGSTFARYSPGGHLVYARDGQLLAVPVDLSRPDRRGRSVPVREDVLTWAGGPVQSFAVAEAGLLAHVAGAVTSPESELVWIDGRGRDEPLGLPAGNYAHPRLSPDGRKLAVTVIGDPTRVWIAHLARLTLMPLNPAASGFLPAWLPGKAQVAFTAQTPRGWGILAADVDGVGPPETLIEGGSLQAPGSFTPDGEILAYTAFRTGTGFDVWILDCADGSTRAFLDSPADESAPAFSADGRLLAYVSNETGQSEVFVISYPERAHKRMASSGGGTQPVWAATGSRLYYRQGDRLMEVEVRTTGDLDVSAPRELFRFPFSSGLWPQTADYDVASADDRLLMLRPLAPQDGSRPVDLVIETGWGWLSGTTPRSS